MNAFKQQCITLRKQDKTLDEIVEITGRSKTSVYFHIKNMPLSPAKQQEISQATRQRALAVAAARKGKALRPFKTFTDWTPDTVLLVSHLLFDGELHPKAIGYANRNKALIDRVQNLIQQHVYETSGSVRFNDHTGVQTIRYGNVELATYLRQKSDELIAGITTFKLPEQREFIRAFFDDEGCMDFSGSTRRIRGYQKDTKILMIVINVLANFGITASFKKPNEVVIVGKDNLLRFEGEINFSPGVCINPNRTNSRWKKNLEKRQLLRMAIESYKT